MPLNKYTINRNGAIFLLLLAGLLLIFTRLKAGDTTSTQGVEFTPIIKTTPAVKTNGTTKTNSGVMRLNLLLKNQFIIPKNNKHCGLYLLRVC